jgi:pilus assembly protein CpaC
MKRATVMIRGNRTLLGLAMLAGATLTGSWLSLPEVAVAGPVGVESPGAAVLARRITLGVGRAIVVDLPGEASEIIVGDPKVANAVVRSARKIFVMGVSTGQTTIIALDKGGAQIANIDLNVGRDLNELSKIIKAALPKSNVTIRQIDYTIILSGEVDSAGEAALALDIAKGFANSVNAGGAAGGAGAAPGGGGASGGSAAASDGAVVSTVTIRGRDQVMVKVTIAEVQRNILKQLGVSSGTAPDTLLKTSWATLTQQNPFTLSGNLTPGALTIPLGTSGAAMTLQAYERYGVSRVLAEPTVTAVSGESAKFTAGGEIPVPQNSTCTPSGASLQPICTVGITFKQYGVTLNITPVVLSEGRILVRLASEVTEIDPTLTITVASIAVPGFRTRKNETSVELPSGGSLATAGLITNNSRQAINGLPGLLNVPILGALFRSRDYLRQETELLIIVTPYIARSTQPGEISRPDDGYADSSDPQAWLLGRVNRLYSTRSNPQAISNLKGRFGFIQD